MLGTLLEILLGLLDIILLPLWLKDAETGTRTPRYPAILLLAVVLSAYVYAAFTFLPDAPYVFLGLLGMGLATVILLWLIREKPRRRRTIRRRGQEVGR